LSSITFQGSIPSSGFGSEPVFMGNLQDKYLAAGGGIGMYTTANPGWDAEWIKQ
jgi:hypothetical protein